MKSRRFTRYKWKRPSEKDANMEQLLKANMPRSNNLDLVILKGHILLEYMLNQFITLMAPTQIDIKKLNISFRHKIEIVHMLGMLKFPPFFYVTLDIFNSLRNQVAHELTINRGLVDKLIKYNSEEIGSVPEDDKVRAKAIKKIVRFWCWVLMGYIQGHHHAEFSEKSGGGE